jgi:hypothetical protein
MNLKKIIKRCLITLGTLYLAIILLDNYILPTDYRACEIYTEQMNGGIQTFQGRRLNIRLCGLSDQGPVNPFYSDEVRLQVFSLEGELLAERFFEPLRGMGDFGLYLKYGNDYLIYNDGELSGFQTKMAMPPTKLDWIRARLPRIWPF